MNRILQKTLAVLTVLSVITGSGAVYASENPPVDVKVEGNAVTVTVKDDLEGELESEAGILTENPNSDGYTGVAVNSIGENIEAYYPQVTVDAQAINVTSDEQKAIAVETKVKEGSVDVTTGDVSIASTSQEDSDYTSGVYTSVSNGSLNMQSGDVNVEGNVGAVGVYSEAAIPLSALNSNPGLPDEYYQQSGVAIGEEATTETLNSEDPTVISVETGNVTASSKAENGFTIGVASYMWAGSADITTKDIDVSGQNNVTGATLNTFTFEAGESTYIGKTNASFSDITASSQGTAKGLNASASGGIVIAAAKDINVKGTIGAEGVVVSAENKRSEDPNKLEPGIVGVSVGNIHVETTDSSSASYTGAIGVNATINTVNAKDESNEVSIYTKDITAAGKDSTGIQAQGPMIQDTNKKPDYTLQIVADGTVSGDGVAIKAVEECTINNGSPSKYDTDHIDVTVWKAVENKDGEIARVVKIEQSGDQITETVDKEASAALEARINYIIKVAEAWKAKMEAAGTGSVSINNNTFDTAHQDERVTITVKLNPDDGTLEGIYYNVDDESSLITLDKLIKNANGTYDITMHRGGAMLLGLKLAPVPVPVPEPTPMPEPAPTPAPTPKPTPGPTPPPAIGLYWEAVSSDAMVYGVKADDHQTMSEVANIVGNYLMEEGASVTFEGVEELLNDEEMSIFNNLTIQDRFLVFLMALGFGDQVSGDLKEMSKDAVDLAADIMERLAQNPGWANDTIHDFFMDEPLTIGSTKHECLRIALVTEKDGNTEHFRYGFIEDEMGVWRLYEIEKGHYEYRAM